jgi:hypothetical protein
MLHFIYICNFYILCHFKFLTAINTIVGAGDAGVGSVLRYSSGSVSDQKIQLLAAPAPQHYSEPKPELDLYKNDATLHHCFYSIIMLFSIF